MFQEFTGKQYLQIDIANNFGLDKLTWDERLSWFQDNQHQLDHLLGDAEEPALYYAGVQAWKKAQNGQPSGYPISLDATSSGIQILAVLAGDRKAAELCNVVDTGRREDAYTGLYEAMVATLGEEAQIERKSTKNAIMTAFYTSTRIPKDVFGEGELLRTFYDTVKANAPGAWAINEAMLAIWDPTAYSNDWVLPDNFHVQVKVMKEVKENVHFLNAPYTVKYHVNAPIEGGRSLGANLVHSIDGMVVREMQRRCNYNWNRVNMLVAFLKSGSKFGKLTNDDDGKMVKTLWGHYLDSGFLSARILDHLKPENLGLVTPDPILLLIDSLPYKPFEVLSVHDCFRVLPNYGNDLRRQYNNLLAELAESDLLSFLVSQIQGRQIIVNKLDPHLSRDIRTTNYALS